jgi:hypothetical protein
VKLMDEPTEDRDFRDWSMGLARVTSKELAARLQRFLRHPPEFGRRGRRAGAKSLERLPRGSLSSARGGLS